MVLQDILGTKAMDGNIFVTQNKSSGKENSRAHPLCNVDLNAMHEVKVQGESRGAWKRVSRVIHDTIVDGGFTKLSGAKRASDWVEVQSTRVHGKKKGRGLAAMEGIEVDGGLAEAVQQPRRTQ